MTATQPIRERPILFSGPMVRAILAGTKTMTRRICEGQRELSCAADWPLDRCRYGQAGERLWVREALNGDDMSYIADGAKLADVLGKDHIDRHFKKLLRKHHVSIFMPRWASRITLEVTDVRVERLQEISEDDAKAEGITSDHSIGDEYGFIATMDNAYRRTFARTWAHINSKRPVCKWGNNPWVWVVSFRRIAK